MNQKPKQSQTTQSLYFKTPSHKRTLKERLKQAALSFGHFVLFWLLAWLALFVANLIWG